jgi:hypothetical protein
MVNRIKNFLSFCILFLFFLAAINPIRFNSTCYPGILCDGTETDFYDCKYDRTQAATNISDLFAIVTRCIGKIIYFIFISNNLIIVY